jgi:hypothetical protein
VLCGAREGGELWGGALACVLPLTSPTDLAVLTADCWYQTTRRNVVRTPQSLPYALLGHNRRSIAPGLHMVDQGIEVRIQRVTVPLTVRPKRPAHEADRPDGARLHVVMLNGSECQYRRYEPQQKRRYLRAIVTARRFRFRHCPALT